MGGDAGIYVINLQSGAKFSIPTDDYVVSIKLQKSLDTSTNVKDIILVGTETGFMILNHNGSKVLHKFTAGASNKLLLGGVGKIQSFRQADDSIIAYLPQVDGIARVKISPDATDFYWGETFKNTLDQLAGYDYTPYVFGVNLLEGSKTNLEDRFQIFLITPDGHTIHYELPLDIQTNSGITTLTLAQNSSYDPEVNRGQRLKYLNGIDILLSLSGTGILSALSTIDNNPWQTISLPIDYTPLANEIYDNIFQHQDDYQTGGRFDGAPDALKVNSYLDNFMNIIAPNIPIWTIDYTPDSYDPSLKLYARYWEHPVTTNKTAIVVHGVMTSSLHAGPWAQVFHDLGYNVLTPDLRGYGLSQDSNRNAGILDSIDIMRWIEKLVDADKNAEIILFGWSMGALVVLEASYRSRGYSNVKAVIEDCGASQLAALYDRVHANYPLLTPKEFQEVIDDLDDILYKKQKVHLSEGLTEEKLYATDIPVLTIHGTNDGVINPSYAYRISSLVSHAGKRRYLVDGAPHYQSIAYGHGYDEYLSQIKQFLGGVGQSVDALSYIIYEDPAATVITKNIVRFGVTVVGEVRPGEFIPAGNIEYYSTP